MRALIRIVVALAFSALAWNALAAERTHPDPADEGANAAISDFGGNREGGC